MTFDILLAALLQTKVFWKVTLHLGFLDTEDEGNTIVENEYNHALDDETSHPRRLESPQNLLFVTANNESDKPQNANSRKYIRKLPVKFGT